MSTEVTASAGPNQSQPSSAPLATATAAATTRRIGCTSGSFRLRSERVQSWPFNGAASSGLGRLLKRGNSDRRLRNLIVLHAPLPNRLFLRGPPPLGAGPGGASSRRTPLPAGRGGLRAHVTLMAADRVVDQPL